MHPLHHHLNVQLSEVHQDDFIVVGAGSQGSTQAGGGVNGTNPGPHLLVWCMFLLVIIVSGLVLYMDRALH